MAEIHDAEEQQEKQRRQDGKLHGHATLLPVGKGIAATTHAAGHNDPISFK
jgi:hypothetical protein